MALKEISLAEALSKSSGTSYFSTFVQLVGRNDNLLLYEGITKDDIGLIKEIQAEIDAPLSHNYLEFLKISNGGVLAGIKFYSLLDKNNIDSIYYRNFKSDTRKKLKLADNELIVGESSDGIVCLQTDSDEDDGSFTLMDIYNKEKLEFVFLEDLICFRFYWRLVLQAKKKKIEKEKLDKAKKRFQEELILQNKIRDKRKKERKNQINRF